MNRFWSKVDKLGTDECWEWTASRVRGYGQFQLEGKPVKAHRVAFFLTNGRWPEPCCCHHCDNPACCNPAHLYEGTHSDNAADCKNRGRLNTASGASHGWRKRPECVPRGDGHWSKRHPERIARGDRHSSRTKPHRVPRGERAGSSKLTDQAARDIRANYALCRVTMKSLAARYGVSAATVCMVVNRSVWGHVA